jgi:hypothetical protein
MKGFGTFLKRRPVFVLLTVLIPLCSIGLVFGASFNEHDAKGQKSDLDKKNVWVLDFRFKAPRLITVNIPGRGTRICWYLWYQVINNPPPHGTGSKEPVTFIPDFQLVTQDSDNPAVYHDEILPKVQDAINKIENPSGADYLMAKNSVTIAATPIPPSKEDAYPTAITGVAIWDGCDADPKKRKKKDLSDSNRYSIFVAGLSNGWVLTDSPTGKGASIVRRKTLQLNFKRLGDRFTMRSEDISFLPPAEWIYRASSLRIPEALKKGK